MMQFDIVGLAALMGVPSAITGLCFWMIQRKITKRDAKHDRQDEARKTNELLLIKAVGASLSLGEATAKSVQRMDGECNGDMSRALAYAQTVKHEQKEFLHRQGIENLY
jgi:hypothetical protein